MGRFESIDAGGVTSRVYVADEEAANEAGDRPDNRPGNPAGVVVFHAWWGLNDDVTAYADRLASAGFAVEAPDLYRGAMTSWIEEAERLSDSMDQDAADSIALAVVDRLAARLGKDARIGAVGFSLGAAWSVWAAAHADRIAASVVYYGSLEGPSVSRASTPVLGHFAETDPFEPDEGIERFEAALRSAGREVAIHRYPGTGHWFAEPSRDAYRPEAAELAFQRTVEFLRLTLGRHR